MRLSGFSSTSLANDTGIDGLRKVAAVGDGPGVGKVGSDEIWSSMTGSSPFDTVLRRPKLPRDVKCAMSVVVR